DVGDFIRDCHGRYDEARGGHCCGRCECGELAHAHPCGGGCGEWWYCGVVRPPWVPWGPKRGISVALAESVTVTLEVSVLSRAEPWPFMGLIDSGRRFVACRPCVVDKTVSPAHHGRHGTF